MGRQSTRRRFTAILLGAGMGVLAMSPPAGAQPANTVWPMLQGNERHTGRSGLLGPIFLSGTPQASNIATWVGFDKVKSSPTIGPDGTIYVGVGWSVCAINPTPTSNGYLVDRWPLNPPPLNSRCRKLVADASASSVAIGRDPGDPNNPSKWKLYIGDRGNALNAFDQDGNNDALGSGPPDGDPYTWRYSHGHEGDVRSSALIGPDGVIYVGFSQNLDGPGALTALNPDGTYKWSYSGGNFVNTSSPTLDVDNGVIYFGDIAGWFHAVDKETGSFNWKLKIGNLISASPVVLPPGPGLPHGRIYVGSTNGLSAVDPVTQGLDVTFGAGTGTFTTDGIVDQTPAIAEDGTIYVGSYASKRKTFYAVNPNGTQKWVFGPVQLDADNAAFVIVSADKTVYVAIGKTVYALRPTDGSVLWSYTVPMNIISFPAIGGTATPATGGTATLYVPSYDGNVYALSSYRGPQGPGNTQPIVTATARANNTTVAAGAPLTVVPGQYIVFTGSGNDADNDPLTFTWNFADGSTFVGTSVLHTYGAAGTYNVTLTVSDGVTADVVLPFQITVTPAAGVFCVTDDFNDGTTPDLGSAGLSCSPSGQAAWQEVGGNGQFKIASNELRNEAGAACVVTSTTPPNAFCDHLAVLPSVTGPTQTVAADFASVDNGPVPRMGIVLRYQDPQNFYLAHRKPGPASFLRISKIVGGTETILAQVGLSNPAVNSFFRLSATAVGTTISLDLNGVPKLSADDTAFSSGSIGVLLGTGTSSTASYRVDNFSASVQ